MLNSLSPIDGRYHGSTQVLRKYFSEFALIYFRVFVEVKYLELLLSEGILNFEGERQSLIKILNDIVSNFSESDGQQIKQIESVTNHDVKAVEYFIRQRLKEGGFNDVLPFVHFGLTSQDINNTAFPLMVKEAMEKIVLPALKNIMSKLYEIAEDTMGIPMLARTHGQAASPTTVGKEIFVFVNRLHHQIQLLNSIPHSAKFGGATGNFNAHTIAYPEIDWETFGNKFVENILGLKRNQVTTQIEPYDDFAALCQGLTRINTILIDFCRDIWTYVSLDYFKQKVKEGEVGSSAMPHKVNPIDFENAEGNLGIANALLNHFAETLPISRLQRDLPDSTVLRNVGVPFGHMLIAFKSLEKGLGKLTINQEKIEKDLIQNWAVVAEAIQTVLRREGIEDAYERLKDLTRGADGINQQSINSFIDSLEVSDEVKSTLRSITPMNYTGNASTQVRKLSEW
ncbi:MAG: adenylosuccinate lyase [Saprospiraceae bacterium]|nr:adenylosuccinate lyase [Saprospiraceae bacterium]